MKKLFILTLLSVLLLTACSIGEVQKQEQGESEISDTVKNVESQKVALFKKEGFSFEYPASWTTDGNEYLYVNGAEKGEWKLQVYTADFMGPRCSVKVADREFAAKDGKKWSYVVMKAGVPEDLIEMCGDAEEGKLSDERTAEISLMNNDGKYLAILFYSYNVLDEDLALAEFEQILASVKF